MLDPVLKAALREDLKAFIEKSFETVDGRHAFCDNWHIDAIAHQLTQTYEGSSKVLLITQPPRSLKSISSSVAFVAWLLGRDPKLRFICVSYSQDLANDLAGQCRKVMESDWYREVFPETVLSRNTESKLVTTKGGQRLATSVGGTITGRGADIIIIDDPLNVSDAFSETQRAKAIKWYRETMPTRLDDKKKGRVIVTMQRVHEGDLAGYLIERGGIAHLNLPAIATEDERIEVAPGRFYTRKIGELLHAEREGHEELENLKRDLGTLAFSAQYQQQPLPADGDIVKRAWLRTYSEVPTPQHFKIVQSWDLASATTPSADFSACVTAMCINRDVYVLDVWRGRLGFPALKRKIIEHARAFNPDTVLIEKAGPGLGMLQELKEKRIEGLPPPISIRPDGDKKARLEHVTPMIENGCVYLPERAEWMGTFLSELLGFPGGKHDDQVDAFSQLLNWLKSRSGAMGKEANIPGFGAKLIVDGIEDRSPPAAERPIDLYGNVWG